MTNLAARSIAIAFLLLALVSVAPPASRAADEEPFKIHWADNFLTIGSPRIPGGEIKILYLEAYCRAGSTDREWGETVIGHHTELVATEQEGRVLKLKDTLRDGVTVEHTLTASLDAVDFQLIAHNPTDKASAAHWAQPCMRVDKFTGCSATDARALVPEYARKCFFFVDGKLTRLPTTPWAEKARYTPGQVYCPKEVDRNDVNPRPLSSLVPSCGLTGCYSADEKQILAIAWDPYQEIFQGVIACMHADFRLGGLKPGESKKIHGKLYVVPADTDALLKRYQRDFATK